MNEGRAWRKGMSTYTINAIREVLAKPWTKCGDWQPDPGDAERWAAAGFLAPDVEAWLAVGVHKPRTAVGFAHDTIAPVDVGVYAGPGYEPGVTIGLACSRGHMSIRRALCILRGRKPTGYISQGVSVGQVWEGRNPRRDGSRERVTVIEVNGNCARIRSENPKPPLKNERDIWLLANNAGRGREIGNMRLVALADGRKVVHPVGGRIAVEEASA